MLPGTRYAAPGFDGGRVLASSKAVPIKHTVAAPSISAEPLEKLRERFTGLDTIEAGRRNSNPSRCRVMPCSTPPRC